ncbi:MAG: hypothetical protein GQ565_00440 [Candidatus Aegiribacteria sp.]|nr:hypothetical protein [Candidatus Aegiribacteria sp.]
MKNSLLAIIAAASGFLLFSGCMGTFETARVVPFKLGATYFATIDASEDDSFTMPGMILETGWPAAPARFGLGLHLRATAVIGSDQNDDNGFMIVWGGKLQIPQNSLIDIALGLDIWGYVPGEIKLYLSRRFGIIEPYVILAVAELIDFRDSDILNADGLTSYTLGTMIELGSGSGWALAAEFEGGDVWVSQGVGLGLIREF